MLEVEIGGLPGQVAAQQQAAVDLSLLEKELEASPFRGGPVAKRERITEPRRLGTRQGARKQEPVGKRAECGVQAAEVVHPPRVKAVESLELRKPERRLHVGDLEVVAQMAENVLVVVSLRHRAE